MYGNVKHSEMGINRIEVLHENLDFEGCLKVVNFIYRKPSLIKSKKTPNKMFTSLGYRCLQHVLLVQGLITQIASDFDRE